MADSLMLTGTLYPKECDATLTFDLNKIVYADRALVGNIWLVQFPEQNDKIPMFCKEMAPSLFKSNLRMFAKEQWFSPSAIVGIGLHQKRLPVVFVKGIQKPIPVAVPEGTSLQEVYDSILEKLSELDLLDDLGLPTDVMDLRSI